MPSFAFHPRFAGHSVRCNPWVANQFIITASDNFGVTGSGKVYVVQFSPNLVGGPPQLVGCFGTPDGAFDACVSELDPNMAAVACGDGLRLYLLPQSLNRDGALPVAHLVEHQAEVSCVAWNQVTKDVLYSASWDGSLKVWNPLQPQRAVMTLHEHLKEVYEVSPSTRDPNLLLSCSGDGMWRLWDVRRGPKSVVGAPGHQHDIILSVDWNKYDGNCFATGGVDKTAKVWDLRRPDREVVPLRGHQGPVRRVRFSPHSRTQLASSGYDFRVCLWDLGRPQQALTHRYEQHREFIVGLEWSLCTPGGVLSASWDGLCYAWLAGQAPAPTHQLQQPLPNAIPPPRTAAPRNRAMGPMRMPPPGAPLV